MPLKPAHVFGLLILTLVGCGESQAKVSTPPSSVQTAAAVSVVSDPATIGAYSPVAVTVRAGETVRWSFVDKNPHSVSADDSATFDSTPMADGHAFSHRFEHAGTYRYHCSIHPEMHGIVVVS